MMLIDKVQFPVGSHSDCFCIKSDLNLILIFAKVLLLPKEKHNMLNKPVQCAENSKDQDTDLQNQDEPLPINNTVPLSLHIKQSLSSSSSMKQ